MASRAENQPLPLNPDGSPDLNRVTIDNITRFGIPEEQAKDLAQMQESHPITPLLEKKMSRRTVLCLPAVFAGGFYLKDSVEWSSKRLTANSNYSTKDTLASNTAPKPTPSHEPARTLEAGENTEIPFPYKVDGWTVVIKKVDIDKYRGQLASKNKDWKNTNISISHLTGYLSEEFFIEQNFSPGIALLNNEMFLTDEERESHNIFYKDGMYRLPTAPVSEDTFLKIESENTGDKSHQVDMFPIELKTGYVLDKIHGTNPKLTSINFKVLFERNPAESIQPEDIYMHGLCLNALSPVKLNKILVPQENDRAFTPTFPADEYGMYLTVPEKIAELPNPYPAEEHPALIRMTRDFTAKICKVPNPEFAAGTQAILASLESFIQEHKLHIQPRGSENTELMNTLNIGTFKLYGVGGFIFNQTESVRPTSETSHSQNTLAELIPIIFHKHFYFERAYDNLNQDQKEKADIILIHAISLLSYLGEEKFPIVLPHAQDMLEKRGITTIPIPFEIARGKFGKN